MAIIILLVIVLIIGLIAEIKDLLTTDDRVIQACCITAISAIIMMLTIIGAGIALK